MSRPLRMNTVLVAPDKFKGSLPAADVADTLAGPLTAAGLEVIQLPLADGGDGTVAAAAVAGYSSRDLTVRGATGIEHTATIATRGNTAIVEIANTCGLGRVF